jgi:hypothetical protein
MLVSLFNRSELGNAKVLIQKVAKTQLSEISVPLLMEFESSSQCSQKLNAGSLTTRKSHPNFFKVQLNVSSLPKGNLSPRFTTTILCTYLTCDKLPFICLSVF